MSTPIQEYLSFAAVVTNLINKISLYGSVIVHPIGFILNVLSILIFMRKRFGDSTMGFYNIIIAIDNNIVIVINFIMSFTLGVYAGNDALVWSSFSCSFFYYTSRVTTSLSSWLNVMVAFDRMVFILFPFKYSFMRNKKLLLVIILVMFLILFLLNSPNLYLYVAVTSTYSNATNKTLITKTCGPPKDLVVVVDSIRIFTRAVIPFILVILINTLLIYKVIKTKAKYKKTSAAKKEYNFIRSIVALSVFFIVSLAPFVITLTVLNIMSQLNQITTKAYLIVYLTYGLSILLSSYNYCFGFFVNLIFNSLFRHETVKFFKSIKKLFKK